MKNVKTFIDEVKEKRQPTPDIVQCLENLEKFVDAFTHVKAEDFNNFEDWKKFVERFVKPGWEDKLSFDDILSNFGFPDEEARELQFLKLQNDTEIAQDFAFRWISKALVGYKPVGCLSDVVNTAFAMEGKCPKGLSEEKIAETVWNFASKLKNDNLSSLWIPTHIVVDCESDDTMVWLMMEYIHRKRSTQLHVLAQLPDDKDCDDVATHLSLIKNVNVFRDADSGNKKNVLKNLRGAW